MILANAEIPLRGVLEHGEVKAELRSGAAKRGEEWGVCGEPIWMGKPPSKYHQTPRFSYIKHRFFARENPGF